jgi:hypothetical protein
MRHGVLRADLAEIFERARFNPVLWLAIKHEHGAQRRFERLERALQLGAYGLAALFIVPLFIRPDAFALYLQLWFLGLVVSYALGFGADAAYVLGARSSAEVNNSLWEALRLTLLPSAVLVEGKYLNAQLRVWRWLLLEAAVRHFVVAALILIFIAILIRISVVLLVTWGGLFLALPLAVAFVYVREPLMRMRTMVALSFAAALNIRDETVAALFAIGVAFIIRLLQVVFLLSLPLQGRAFDSFVYEDYGIGFRLICFWPWLYLFVVYVLFYGLYQRARAWALETVQRHVRTESQSF